VWNVKAKVIRLIVGTTGTVTKLLRQYLSNMPGKHEIKELKQTAVLGTAHTHTHTHTAESANVKVHNILHGRNNITCGTNCKYRTATILHTLESWFLQVYNYKHPV
jgi:hypothetical protein